MDNHARAPDIPAAAEDRGTYAEDVVEQFACGGCFAIRPVTDFSGYVCDGDCAGCPVGPRRCSSKRRRRADKGEYKDISDK